MPIQWDNDELRLFFGCQPAPFGSDGLVSLSYRGGSMNYKIIFDSNEEVVFISGSFEEPLGADSLFELTVRCDRIKVVDDPYYSNQIGLLFLSRQSKRIPRLEDANSQAS